jgi:hypothetical protein
MPNSKSSKIVQKMLKKCQKMKNMSKNGEKMKNTTDKDPFDVVADFMNSRSEK